MEKTNQEFLAEDLKFLGFGETLKTSLGEAMANNETSFELYFAGEIGFEPLHAILYFTKTDPKGFFFFSGYQLALDNKLQYFKIFKGKGVTLKEGFNLLCGRAVFKQLIGKNGQKYDAWMQLDFNIKEGENFKVNTYFGSHSYNLSSSLDELGIQPPSSNWDRQMLLRSLERGNLQSGFITENGELKEVLIEANPKEKTVTIRDSFLPGGTNPVVESPAAISSPGTKNAENMQDKKNLRSKKSKDL